MIKINLLPARKPKRQIDAGQKSLLVGVGGLVAAGVLVFFFVHRPVSDELDRLSAANAGLSRDNKTKKDKLANFEDLKKAVEAAKARSTAIQRLASARAVPAHMLRELAAVLTPGQPPTMSKDMARRVEKDPNREIAADWDPKHVWITRFSEKDARFKLEGGAQSDGDMTQLAKRLQASVYFQEVVPEKGEDTLDKETSITYYRFTITGKVVY
jgi:Tfp pilus assembly protein PilN